MDSESEKKGEESAKNPIRLDATLQEITERKQAEAKFRAANERLSFYTENTPLGFIEWDNQLHVKSWSKRAEEIFGWTEKEIIEKEKTGYCQVYIEDQPRVFKIMEQLISGEIESAKAEYRNYTKDGRVIWCEWFSSALPDKEGRGITIKSLVQDITEHKESEEKTTKAKRLYAFISQVNQKILRLKDENGLFSNACDIALEFGQFEMAWIGLFDNTQKKIVLVDQSGIPENDIHRFTDLAYQPDGPQDMILKTGMHFVCNDIANDLELEGWKLLAAKRDIRSFIVLPVKKSGRIIGTFNLYARELHFFDKEEIELLTEVSGDISFALDLFEKAKKQHATEELLVHNEQRFRALIEKSSDMKTLATYDGELLYISPSVTKMLGYSATEILHKKVAGFIHPLDIPRLVENTKDILRTPGKSFYHEQRLRHKSGDWIWCEGTVTNMLREPGVNAMVANFIDISEKKITETQREFDKNNLKALINNTNDLMWSVDRNFKLITSNQPFSEIVRRMSGKRIERGDNIMAIGFSQEMLNRYKNYYERAFRGETFEVVEHTEIPVEFWSDISFYPILRGDEIIGTACHSRDVTEKRKAALDLEQQNKELIKVNAELDRFVYSASHELRAPLSSILGLINLSKFKLEDADQLHNLDLMETSIKNLDGFITNIVDYSRNSRLQLEHNKIDFKELISESIEQLRYMEHAARTTISVDVTQEVDFYSDRKRIGIVLNNLLSNALKYQFTGAKTPNIKMKVHTFQDHAEIEVSDNGIGIAPEYHTKIFDMFFRLSSKIAGSGIGLYIVKEIIDTLEGSISIDSEEGKGATFTMTLKNLMP